MNSERPDTRQHILDCGQLLVASKGFVGVGLSEILSSAGVPKGSFYHYFASKEVFGCALLETYFDSYMARLDGLFARPGLTAGQRMELYFQRWIETQFSEDYAERCLIVKLAAEVSDLSEAMRTIMMKGTERILGRLTECISEGVAEGSIKSALAPADCATWLYEAWLGASLLTKLRRDRSVFDAALKHTQNLLGLKQG
ncbi:TetR/AcrR family transcriptional regulator [Uliginosibacterium gangwonense]|uniref:TetR/AcrR family transcriptional regulator n=1 Tax=Uliginosibacterium gangwonense TaxID=392736 RepID=UPI0003A409AB|nr:TetR/AcrR family transcriptional regulator [Uliginosibacterium gangwonense]